MQLGLIDFFPIISLFLDIELKSINIRLISFDNSEIWKSFKSIVNKEDEILRKNGTKSI